MPRYLAATLIVTVALSACVTRAHSNTIEVKRGVSVEERVQVARSIATTERQALLRRQIKERFPNLTGDQLRRLRLGWNQRSFRSISGGEPSVIVAVVVEMGYGYGLDPKPVIAAATELLEREINPPSPVPATTSRRRLTPGSTGLAALAG